MEIKSITSRDNERVKFARRLADNAAERGEAGLFFAEGLRLCMDLAEKLPVRVLFATREVLEDNPEFAELAPEVYEVSGPVAEKLADTKTPQGLFCLFEKPSSPFSALRVDDGILICEEIQDPGNIGTILRSAAALGFGGAVLTPGCADPFSPKALRASMGAAARLPIVQGPAADEAARSLHQKGATLYSATLMEAKPLGEVDVQSPFALLVGNEGAGLSDMAVAATDERVYIPMHGGVESMNAAAAAAVLMYHFKYNG